VVGGEEGQVSGGGEVWERTYVQVMVPLPSPGSARVPCVAPLHAQTHQCPLPNVQLLTRAPSFHRCLKSTSPER
jgi:hypothetical protein